MATEADYLRGNVTAIVSATVAQAIAAGTSRTSRRLAAIGQVLARGGAPADVQAMYEKMGDRARRAAVGSYDNLVTPRRRPASRFPYREDIAGRNHRYAGGALRRALNNRDFSHATPQGLSIINVTRLNKEARHWARLNSGAGSVGKGSRKTFEVHASGLIVATLGLDTGPRPAFGAPPGFWWDRSTGASVPWDRSQVGDQEFYPTRRGPKKPTVGIVGRNFLDAAINRVARDLFSEQYGFPRLYRRLWAQATTRDARERIGVTARPSAPGRPMFPTHVRVGSRY